MSLDALTSHKSNSIPLKPKNSPQNPKNSNKSIIFSSTHAIKRTPSTKLHFYLISFPYSFSVVDDSLFFSRGQKYTFRLHLMCFHFFLPLCTSSSLFVCNKLCFCCLVDSAILRDMKKVFFFSLVRCYFFFCYIIFFWMTSQQRPFLIFHFHLFLLYSFPLFRVIRMKWKYLKKVQRAGRNIGFTFYCAYVEHFMLCVWRYWFSISTMYAAFFCCWLLSDSDCCCCGV